MSEQVGDDAEALRSGGPDEFAALFDRYGDAVYSYCLRRTADRAVAEDIAAEVFLEAWRQRETVVSSGGSLRPWLFGVAHNLLRRSWRTSVRSRRALDRATREPASHEDSVDVVVDRIADRQALVRVLDAMGGLPEGQREVLLLWAWEQLSYDDIAVALEISVGTVRSRLNRARRRLAASTSAPSPPPAMAAGSVHPSPLLEGGVA